jgi:carboxyl-terminal processing protease
MKRPNPFLKFFAVATLFIASVFLATSVSFPSFSAGHTAAALAEKELTPKDRLEVFDKVWKGVQELYYDPEFHGVNWDEVGKRYRPQVDGVKSDAEFYALINRMTGELHDAHTRFNTPAQWENRQKQQGVTIGFQMTELEGKVAVTEVFPDSNAAHAGIEPGMTVLTVDGKPIAERIAEVAQKVIASSSDRITRVRVYAGVFPGPAESSFKIGLERADGSKFEAAVTKQIVPRPPDVESHLLPSGYAYIRFDGFQPAVTQEFKEALEKFHGAPGLIVDLRGNGGGRSDVLSALAGFFFNSKTVLAEFMTRKDVADSEKSSSTKEHRKFNAGKEGGQMYAGPIVILTTTYSGSSSELFAGGLQEVGRAKVVGSQTCGCVIGISRNERMKGGGVLEVSQILWFTPRGRKLEGDGVIPDKIVAPTIADLQQKRDVVLEQAVELLKTMSGGG